MGKLFGTNGVRGVFSEDFTLEFVHDLVLSISAYFKEGTILVGYDGRNSSKVISKIVCSTLNSAGINSDLAGLVPTPCLEFGLVGKTMHKIDESVPLSDLKKLSNIYLNILENYFK